MNRLQKKCFLGVMLLHVLPLLIAVVGTAFFNKPEAVIDSPQIIEIIPDNAIVTDGPTGGGSPAFASAPEPIPEPVAKPAPIVQKPAPEPRPEPEPEPEQPKPVEIPKVKLVEKEKEVVSELPVEKKQVKTPAKPVAAPKVAAKTPTKSERKIDIRNPKVINAKERQASSDAAAKAADQRARDQRVSALNSSLRNLGRGLSEPTSFDRGGSGGSGGGQAEINYGDLVLKKYDDAWFPPSEVDDNVAVAKAKVIIARNGNVIASEIIKGSGNAVLDKSVRRALDSVRSVAPFPAGSGDSQRTYIINFNLKSKRGIG